MAEYKALRVPIALIHQHVYGATTRLLKFERKEWPEKFAFSSNIQHFHQSTEITLGKKSIVEWKYRFYFQLSDSTAMTKCRWCNKIVMKFEEEAEHGRCYKWCNLIYDALEKRKVKDCIICDNAPVNPILKHGIPVCSEECWEMFRVNVAPVFEYAKDILREKMIRGEQPVLEDIDELLG